MHNLLLHSLFSHAITFFSHVITAVVMVGLWFKHPSPPHPDAPKPFYKVERG